MAAAPRRKPAAPQRAQQRRRGRGRAAHNGDVQRPPAGTIPDAPGSYQFKDRDGRVIYVGKARSLRQRLSNYFQNPYNLHPRTAQMVATAETVEWIQVRNDVEALMLEYNLIKEHRPRFNIRYRDDKSYPYLAVTIGEEYPRALDAKDRVLGTELAGAISRARIYESAPAGDPAEASTLGYEQARDELVEATEE